MSLLSALGPDAERFAGKTVLLTGSSGFLGHHFLDAFRELNEHLKKPVQVLGVDNFVASSRRAFYHPLDDHVMEMWADVTQPPTFPAPIHFIIHAAGIASPTHYRKHPLETIDVAVQGTRNMLELARINGDYFEGLLVFSSSEIYGNPSIVPTPETYNGNVSSIGPRSCYDESKRMLETLSVVYKQKYGVPVKIVRPFNVYGPGMMPNDRRVIPMFTYEGLSSRPVPVFNDGKQTRSFCYIRDALNGFFRVLLNGSAGEVYNIGDDREEISMRDLADYFAHRYGVGVQNTPYPDTYPSDEPDRRCPDLSKAREWLNYEPSVFLEKGLELFVEWASGRPEYRS